MTASVRETRHSAVTNANMRVFRSVRILPIFAVCVMVNVIAVVIILRVFSRSALGVFRSMLIESKMTGTG